MHWKNVAFKTVFILLNIIYAIIIIVACYETELFSTFIIFLGLYMIISLVLAVWGTVVRNTLVLAVYFYLNLVAANILLFGTLFFHYFWSFVSLAIIEGFWRDKLNGDGEYMRKMEKMLGCCGLVGDKDYINNNLSIPPYCYCQSRLANPYKRRLNIQKLKTPNFVGTEDDSPYETVSCAGCVKKFEKYFELNYLYEYLGFLWSLFVILVIMIAMVILLFAVRLRTREAYFQDLAKQIEKNKKKTTQTTSNDNKTTSNDNKTTSNASPN